MQTLFDTLIMQLTHKTRTRIVESYKNHFLGLNIFRYLKYSIHIFDVEKSILDPTFIFSVPQVISPNQSKALTLFLGWFGTDYTYILYIYKSVIPGRHGS